MTIQDIADALGLSRNTISKALNDHPEIPKTTRDKVLHKAAELKYKQFAHLEYAGRPSPAKMGNVALLTRGEINTISFYSATINGIETKLSSNGCNLILTLVKSSDIESGILPPSINKLNIDGIICIEIFDKNYIETVLDAGLPVVFIDSLPNTVFPGRKYNIVLMENEVSSYTLTRMLIDRGHRSIGFVGDFHHCRSFYERWLGYDRALRETGHVGGDSFSITLKDTNPYLSIEWMKDQLLALKKLPSAFVCANDDMAISVIRSLKEMGHQVPSDIEVTGFDDIPNAEIIDPPLTTVHTYRHELGARAAESLFDRMEQPDRHNEIVHLETHIITRGSTK
jgi:LacI family transcriptional regulator